MREERQQNAFAALDILARADSAAFAHSRSDAATETIQIAGKSYTIKQTDPKEWRYEAGINSMNSASLDSESAKRQLIRALQQRYGSRSDAAPAGACTFILVDGSVDQVIQHTGAWQSIVAREVRDLKAMDCGRVTTKEYANESVGYSRHDSVRKDAAPDTAETQWKVTYKVGSNPEQSVTVKASNADEAEELAKHTSTGSRFLWDDVVSVKRV